MTGNNIQAADESRQHSAPMPDYSAAKAFLATLDGEAGEFTFQTIDDLKARSDQSLASVLNGSLKASWPRLVERSARGAGIFVTVNRTNLKGRRAENIVAVRCFVADLDGVPRGNIARLGLEPHILVQTSEGKYHAYWKVAGARLEDFTETQERLNLLLGSDPNVKDLSRVMRLPGFPHQKEPDRPFAVTMARPSARPPFAFAEFQAELQAAEQGHAVDLPAICRTASKIKGNSFVEPGIGFLNGQPMPDYMKNNPDLPQVLEAQRACIRPWAPEPPLYSTEEAGKLISALSFLHAAATPYETWWPYGQAIHNANWGERGFQIFDHWSKLAGAKYDPDACQKTWRAFETAAPRRNRINIATIYYDAREAGWEWPKPPPQSPSTPEPLSGPSENVATTDDLEFARLATLAPLEYDRQRKSAAKRLGLRTGVLDSVVQAKRAPAADDGDNAQGRALALSDPVPWPHEVDGATVLSEIAEALKTYLVMESGSPEACALWVVHTHAIEAFENSPRLAITSAHPECGKTTLLDAIGHLVPRALSASNISTAAVFRTIEAVHPTLLIDEADTFLNERDELHGVLNAGHKRGGAVVRIVGEDNEPRQFQVYGAVAIAMIGKLPETLASRSIPIRLKRKRREEAVQALRLRRPEQRQKFLDLQQKAARWVADNRNELRAAVPAIPEKLGNRAADNWEPLFAIADAAGGAWPARAREIAARVAEPSDSYRLQLLADIRSTFQSSGKAALSSVDLVCALAAMEGQPWAEFGRTGRPITANRLARLLRDEGIAPGTIRTGPAVTLKGYRQEQFADAFARYLPAASSNVADGDIS